MGLLDKIKQQSSEPTEDFSLNKQELETLLLLIKEATFKGEHIESIYSIVYKLQQQYLQK